MNIAHLNFLVVQDNAVQRQWLSSLLGNLGAVNVTDTVDSHVALQMFRDRSQHIDISLIDMHMPGMDGMEMIRHMANTNSNTAVIMSGAVDPALLFSVETLSKAYGIDLIGFVQQPAGEETIAALLKRYMLRRKRDAMSINQGSLIVPQFSINDILLAMENNQIAPWFQPKVDLASGRVSGVEAFARWTHPGYGVILPARFIPILERHNEMGRLTALMIDQSAAACRRWHDEGFLLSVSINLGSSLLSGPHAADAIAEQVAAHRLDAPFVIFEITESALNNESPAGLENMLRLRMKGFELSVDDYGTGHTSMQQLLRIPFSELKIDRSFVAGATEKTEIGIVLSSSLALARKLERNSVAVGIETREEWDLLKKMGCTYGQGYYIAMPMEALALPNWMREWAQFF